MKSWWLLKHTLYLAFTLLSVLFLLLLEARFS